MREDVIERVVDVLRRLVADDPRAAAEWECRPTWSTVDEQARGLRIVRGRLTEVSERFLHDVDALDPADSWAWCFHNGIEWAE